MTIIELFEAMDELIPRTRDGDTTKRISLLKNQAEALYQEHSTLQSLYVALQLEKAKINKERLAIQTQDTQTLQQIPPCTEPNPLDKFGL